MTYRYSHNHSPNYNHDYRLENDAASTATLTAVPIHKVT